MFQKLRDFIIILLFKDKIIEMYNTITDSIRDWFYNKGLE